MVTNAGLIAGSITLVCFGVDSGIEAISAAAPLLGRLYDLRPPRSSIVQEQVCCLPSMWLPR